MANLKALHVDLDTGETIAKNIVVSGGGGGGSFLPLTGGTLSGYLTLSGAPVNNLHAVTKLYVDTAVTTLNSSISLLETEINQLLSTSYVNKTGDTMSGLLTLSGNPVNNLHAATKQYVDTQALLKIGGTLSGYLTLHNNPVVPLHAVTKQYVDSLVGSAENLENYLQLAGGIMTGLLTLSADPVNPLHAATKQYVDGVAQGLDPKASVRVATTANITLSGLQTVDGIAVQVDDRVLVKNQTDPSQNGLFIVSNLNWQRASDANSSSKVTSGLHVYVESGTTNQQSQWILITTGTIVLGTTPLTFSKFSSINGTFVEKAGDTMTGFLTLNSSPTNLLHAATKQYVDISIDTRRHVHTQSVNGSVWVINHLKNKLYPIVQVWISNELTTPDRVVVIDANTIHVHLGIPSVGFAVVQFGDN